MEIGKKAFSLPELIVVITIIGILAIWVASIDFKSIMETVFWFAFLLWNCWFIYLVIKVIDFKELFNFQITSMLALVYLLWGTFSLFLGPAIYVDDWGYVRIFTLWNLLGMSIIMIKNYTPNKWFFYFSSIILCFLLIRLIVRV